MVSNVAERGRDPHQYGHHKQECGSRVYGMLSFWMHSGPRPWASESNGDGATCLLWEPEHMKNDWKTGTHLLLKGENTRGTDCRPTPQGWCEEGAKASGRLQSHQWTSPEGRKGPKGRGASSCWEPPHSVGATGKGASGRSWLVTSREAGGRVISDHWSRGWMRMPPGWVPANSEIPCYSWDLCSPSLHLAGKGKHMLAALGSSPISSYYLECYSSVTLLLTKLVTI